MSEGDTLQATYTYDANGNRQTLTYANGVVESYQYNKANWITGLTNSKAGNTLSSHTYTYYASGSQKSETTNTGVATSYTYDDLGRLTRESEANGLTLAYTYDANGNRTQMTASGTDSYTTAYTYDANNRLTTEAKTQSGTTTTSIFTYDDNGNLLTELDATNTAVVNHSYDGFNRLISSVVGTTAITYTYNPQGIRTSRTVGTTTTQYLLDGGNVVGEITNGTTTTYLRGTNLISDGTNYYLYNAHGDVVQLTDSTGAVTQTYEYDVFGNEKNPSDTDTNPFRYCGEYYDTETGLYYLRARYYDPTVGRFTQEDTHWNTANMIYGDNPQKINEREDALGLKTYSYAPQILSIMQAGNLYVYGTSNPLKYYDPSGAAGELTLTWTSSMWWLLLADGPLPIGDVIYGIGIVVATAIDAVHYIGIDNIIRMVSDLPDAVRNTFSGGGSSTPPDPNWGEGFKTFRQLKRYLGSPGEGNQWHHIVEQNQIRKSGFSCYQVHNTNNVVKISKDVHKLISAYYSSIDPQLSSTQRVRDWLAGQSFDFQYEFGLNILRQYGVFP